MSGGSWKRVKELLKKAHKKRTKWK